MLKRILIVILILILLAVFGIYAALAPRPPALAEIGTGKTAEVAASPNPTLEPGYWPTSVWRTSVPEDQGMDSERLAQMLDHIEEERLNLHSVLVIRNGYLVSEVYYHPYTQERSAQIASVTKSVIGMLVGIAIDEGTIQGVDQPLVSFFPDTEIANLDGTKQAITLEHLLSLTAGMECNDLPGSGQPGMEGSENWVAYMLDRPMSSVPGEQFNYCNGVVHLLSAVLQKATGMSTREFANQTLFQPLGISDKPEAYWQSDPQGIPVGGYGLYLTPREMAKLGILYLNGGEWDGKQVVSPAWVAASTTAHTVKDDGYGYGYLWTIDEQKQTYSALGMGGQHIHVAPELNLVVVFTAGLTAGNNADTIPLKELVDDYILPSVKSDQPIAANPEGAARLLDATHRSSSPPAQPVGSLPEIARRISGKTYQMEANPIGWQELRLYFQDGKDTAEVVVNDAQPTLLIGLDNIFRVYEVGDNQRAEALRGTWVSEDTFLVEEILAGELSEQEYRIVFSGDQITVTARNKILGGELAIHGSLTDEP